MNASKGKIACLAVSALAFLLGPFPANARTAQGPAGTPVPVLTVLFDNYPFAEGCATGWGFSALITGLEKTILFDTGLKEDIFLKNVEALNVNLADVDLVFISHDHLDHTGGLPAFLRARPGIPVYLPAGADPAFQASVRDKGGQPVPVAEPFTLFPGVRSTGDLGTSIHEQALVLDSSGGLVVITGCAHPGIVHILEKARDVGGKNIWMVLGGFHLIQTPADDVEKIIARFKELGVKRVGATHCTGDAAIALFRKAFGADFVEMGVGRKIELGVR